MSKYREISNSEFSEDIRDSYDRDNNDNIEYVPLEEFEKIIDAIEFDVKK